MYFYPKNLSLSTVLVLFLSVFVAYWKTDSLYDWCIWFALSVLFYFTIKYHWKRRWLYYYASKFGGPFALPLIGNAHYFIGPFKDVVDKALKLANDNSEIFRLWLGNYLCFVDTCPEHVEIILNKCLEKPPMYEIITGNELSNSLFMSPVNQWKKNRKLINPTFNSTIVKSFQVKFMENSKIFVDSLKNKCHNEIDIFPILWKATLETACETLLDLDRSSVDNPNQLMSQLARAEEVCVQRSVRPWLYPTIFWKMSPLYKELQIITSELKNFVRKMIQIKRSEQIDLDDETKNLQFMNHLIKNETKLTENELIEEVSFMLTASSESTASAQSFVLLVLAMIPEIQQKIFAELYAIFGDNERDATLEDLNRMDYLERVIKETMRLFPSVLLIARFVDEDLKIDNCVFPKGSSFIVPIVYLHRNPKWWKDPLKFDPDRFLPEETKRRHRCTYIPFSSGPRNCPGNRFAMMSMKTTLSTLLRQYKVVSCNYQSLEDIKMLFKIVTKPPKDLKLVLEKRA